MYKLFLLFNFIGCISSRELEAQNPMGNAYTYEGTLYRDTRSDIVQRLHFEAPRNKDKDSVRSRVYVFQTSEGYFLKEFILHPPTTSRTNQVSEYALVALRSPKVERQLDRLFQHLLHVPWVEVISRHYTPPELRTAPVQPRYISPWQLKVVHNDNPRVAKNIERVPQLSLQEVRRRALLVRLRAVLAPYLH